MPVLVSHPTGNQNVRAVVGALARRGQLDRFVTTIAWDANGWLHKMLPAGLQSELARRAFRDLPKKTLETFPLREWGRLFAQKMGWSQLTSGETAPLCVDQVYRRFDESTARLLERNPERFSGVYSYEDGALETFRKAQELDIPTYYDLPIAYWETLNRLLREEAERYPEWVPTLRGLRDSSEKHARKTAELELADNVVVASHFVRNSLPEDARKNKRIVFSPFGTPQFQPSWMNQGSDAPATSSDRPLRVLFAGSMTQRKGLADLFAAMRLLDTQQIELHVLGAPQLSLDFYREAFPNFVHEASRPHSEVLKLMESCDVFIMPSLVEGRALVQQEAMTAGLPLVATSHAGGEDLIEEGDTGFLIPIRSPDAIAERLRWFLDNRAEIPRMRMAAHRKAQSYTWEAYANKITDLIVS